MKRKWIARNFPQFRLRNKYIETMGRVTVVDAKCEKVTLNVKNDRSAKCEKNLNSKCEKW